MEDDEIRITLRMPTALRDDLKHMADQAGRSMNSEIITRLEDTLYADIDNPATFYPSLADAQFVRGIQIGTIEFLLANDDPIKAMHKMRDTLQRPATPIGINLKGK